jgi:hypothetical protein
MVKPIFLSLLLAVTALPVLAEEDWSSFHACLSRHKTAVEQAEPSLHEGARLVVDVLCVNEASALGNAMLKSPERQDDIRQRGVGGAFTAFLSVMRRETTTVLFETRKIRLGL